MNRLSHLASDGRAQMVNVSAKPMSVRRAVAVGKIRLQRETLALISKDEIAKGNDFATAQIAGIQPEKQTGHLITLCHTLPLRHARIDTMDARDCAEVAGTARKVAQTGLDIDAIA